jgi:peptidyl-prolyl cis-trans isomerase D
MLHFLRRNKNSKLVWAGLAIIIGVFTFWGIGVGVSGETVSTIATVDGRPIEQIQVQRAERNLHEAYREALKEQFTPEMRERLNIRQRAIDSLIDREVLLEHAEALGIATSDQELRDEIAGNPAFQIDGRFSRDGYIRALRYAGYTPADFEEGLRSEILIQRLNAVIADGVSVSDTAVRDEILTKEQKVSIGYVKVKASEFTMEVPVDEEILRKSYDAHRDRYQDPERVRIELIAYGADQFPVDAPTEEEIATYYEENRTTQFTQPLELRARHILIKAGQDADEATRAEARKQAEEIEKQLRDGADFAKLAREKSQDEGSAKSGGDLGFFGKGRMVKPFEEAALALAPGETSGVVETPFGFHVIRVEEKREEREKPLDEVREEVVKALTGEKTRAAAQAAAAEDRAAWQAGAAPAELAAARGLELETPEPLARNDSIAPVGRSLPLMSDLFALEAGGLTEPVDANGTWVVARVVEKIPQTPKEFEAVRDQVETAYRLDQGTLLAKAAASKLLEEAKAAGTLEGVAVKSKRDFAKSDPVTRAGGYIPGIGASNEVKDAAFKLNESSRLPDDVYQVAGDWVILEFAELDSPSDEEIAKQMKSVRDKMVQARRQSVFSRYLAGLKQKATVSINVQKLESMPVG